MISAGSRYEEAGREFTVCHEYNEWGFPVLDGDENNRNLRVRKVNRDTLYRMNTVVPPLNAPFNDSVDEYIQETQDFQYLGYKFMGDARRWWELAEANTKVWYPLDVVVGEFIRIPI